MREKKRFFRVGAAALALLACAVAWPAWRSASEGARVRLLEPRLSGGGPWAPLAAKAEDRGGRALAAVPSRGYEPRHRDALLQLLANRSGPAIVELTALSATSRNPSVWNDLGAAHYAAGHDREALAAMDQALLLRPRYAEALFNRALVLERLHLRDSAAAAWRVFLAHADDDGWRDEGLRHLAPLEAPLRTAASEIERAYARLQLGDRTAAREAVRLDAGDARYFGEIEGLSRWGEAWLRRDVPAADRHLAAMRTLASELEATNDEVLFAEAVAAIERAGVPQRDALARGHLACRNGRLAYDGRRMADAESLLTAAARDLASGGSAYALQARLFAAMARYWQGHHADAEAEYRSIATAAGERYAALGANLEWQLAAAAIGRAEKGTALLHLSKGIDAFTRLGERSNAAFLHNIASQVYDGARDPQRAAAHRGLALRELGKTSDVRLVHAVNGIVYDALQREEWRVARSFVNVALAINARAQDAEFQTAGLLRRARLHAHLGDRAAAESDLRAAAAVTASVADPAHREKLQIDCNAATALITEDPLIAVPLLTETLQFHGEKGSRRLMPELYLRRGRMHLSLGDHARAASDFESGIVLVEQSRATLARGERRWGILDAASELFDEATLEALRSGPEPAFAYAERKRARSLADGGQSAFVPAQVPSGAVIIEYASLPNRLLIFTVGRSGYSVRDVAVSRQELEDLATRFVQALRENDAEERKRVAGKLQEHLIAPVRSAIAAHDDVVFVTDAPTAGVPFAALPGGNGRTLVEEKTISVSPSARAYLASRTRSTQSRADVLIVDGPINEALERLTATSAEAQAVQRAYPAARRLSGADATREAFVRESRNADVIHFAGHGLASVESAALVLTATANDPGILDAASISRLAVREADVVVLAACDTARGPVRSAEGVLSVTHAFLQAGAATVVATLWPLEDREAAAFFPRLHRHLARGLPAARALRLAQIECMQSSPKDRAATWAAVQVVGY